MTKFKFYKKKEKKFTMVVPKNIWDKRSELGIWNMHIGDSGLLKLLRFTKSNKNLDLYLKHNNKFHKATTKLIKDIKKENKDTAKQEKKNKKTKKFTFF